MADPYPALPCGVTLSRGETGSEDFYCSSMWSSWGCSAAAGLLGALSAASAKFALGADYMRNLCEAAVGERADICDWVSGSLHDL